MATYEAMKLDIQEGVATITLNRPDKLNALNSVLLRELCETVDELRKNDEAKVVVLTGAGRGFCSGADLGSRSRDSVFKDRDIQRNTVEQPLGRYGILTQAINEFPKPTIAAVNGVAAGAGMALALGCDVRIAADNARFSAVSIKRGLVPDCGTTYYLPRLVGVAKALEIMWTGNTVDAKEAERIGLVSRLVPAANLLEEVRTFASQLAQSPSIAIEIIKRMTYEGLKVGSIATQLSWEDSAAYICVHTEDFEEGVNSFMAKREPKFKGR